MNIFRNTKSERLESNQVQYGEETVNKATKVDNETNGFIQDMSKLLAETVKQHHIVDNEHDVLGQLFDKVKIHMNEISNLTKNTNGLTDRLYSEGNNLIKITEHTVKKSYEGKNAIEAARAGEQGKGFAVVSGEIKKLAEMTKQSTKDISSLIGSIEDETKIVLNNSDKSNEVIARGVRASGNAAEKIEESLSSVAKVEHEVKDVIEVLIDQKSHIKNMSNEIVDVDEILKITSKTIINHIEAASVVDRQLEEIKNTVNRNNVRYKENNGTP